MLVRQVCASEAGDTDVAGNVEPQGPSKLPSSRGENGELGTIGTYFPSTIS